MASQAVYNLPDRGGRMLDQQLVEIERPVDIVLGGEGNPQAADQAIIGTRIAARVPTLRKAATSPRCFAFASLRAKRSSP